MQSSHGHEHTPVGYLVKHGANPNIHNEDDHPLLLAAITSNNFLYSMELIKNGAILTQEMRDAAKNTFEPEYQAEFFELYDSIKQ